MSKKIAILYDFDKTLCTKDMQEYSFIPMVNMESDDFWSNVDDLAQKGQMDRILAYMYYMLQKARENNISITKEQFHEAGKNIELYKGVEEWFTQINHYAQQHDIELEHYIISSGIKEIIQGCPIHQQFKKIYACEFHYDDSGIADWPGVVVNYTSKTQFLYRINKGVLNIYEDERLNAYTPQNERAIPFRNMLYIGDGMTDVPCMKLVKSNGGTSIAVYHNDNAVAKELLERNRVDFIAKADYTLGKELDKIVKKVIAKMALEDDLVNLNEEQKNK